MTIPHDIPKAFCGVLFQKRFTHDDEKISEQVRRTAYATANFTACFFIEESIEQYSLAWKKSVLQTG